MADNNRRLSHEEHRQGLLAAARDRRGIVEEDIQPDEEGALSIQDLIDYLQAHPTERTEICLPNQRVINNGNPGIYHDNRGEVGSYDQYIVYVLNPDNSCSGFVNNEPGNRVAQAVLHLTAYAAVTRTPFAPMARLNENLTRLQFGLEQEAGNGFITAIDGGNQLNRPSYEMYRSFFQGFKEGKYHASLRLMANYFLCYRIGLYPWHNRRSEGQSLFYAVYKVMKDYHEGPRTLERAATPYYKSGCLLIGVAVLREYLTQDLGYPYPLPSLQECCANGIDSHTKRIRVTGPDGTVYRSTCDNRPNAFERLSAIWNNVDTETLGALDFTFDDEGNLPFRQVYYPPLSQGAAPPADEVPGPQASEDESEEEEEQDGKPKAQEIVEVEDDDDEERDPSYVQEVNEGTDGDDNDDDDDGNNGPSGGKSRTGFTRKTPVDSQGRVLASVKKEPGSRVHDLDGKNSPPNHKKPDTRHSSERTLPRRSNKKKKKDHDQEDDASSSGPSNNGKP